MALEHVGDPKRPRQFPSQRLARTTQTCESKLARASALAGMVLSELGQPGVLEPNALLPDGIDPDTTKWNAGCSAEYFLLQRGAATVERLPVACWN
jgi:hypothetical protein